MKRKSTGILARCLGVFALFSKWITRKRFNYHLKIFWRFCFTGILMSKYFLLHFSYFATLHDKIWQKQNGGWAIFYLLQR